MCLFRVVIAIFPVMFRDLTGNFSPLFAAVVTVSALLVVYFAAFRSVGMSLRLALTIAVTLVWCYGSGVIVFQSGAFSSANSKMATTRAIGWLYVPLFLCLSPSRACVC